MSLENFIIAIVLGGIAGVIAEKVVNFNSGLVLNIILGIVGAVVGIFLLVFFGASLGGGYIASVIAAIIGAGVVIWGYRLVAQR